MEEIKALSATGMLGSGYSEASLKRAMEWQPDFIAADAGSTDGGPDALATGKCHFSRPAVKRDIRLMLLAARRAGIPLIIGSAGSAGGDLNLQWTVDIVKEIAGEDSLHFPMGVIHSEQDREYLKARLREGKVTPLKPAPPFDDEVINRSIHIVGMMGHEPIARALEEGAEVVVGGRASDTTLFAALPPGPGLPRGPGLARRQYPGVRRRLRRTAQVPRLHVRHHRQGQLCGGAPGRGAVVHPPERGLPHPL